MAELIDLAVTAAGNNTRSGPNWPENMQFRQVNDAGRELEAMIAREFRDRNMSIAASGSSNAFAVTTNQTATSYYDNMLVGWTANHTITGPATLNVNGLGAKQIVAQDGTALARNDITNGQKLWTVYKTSANAFQIVGGRAAGSSADILARVVKVGTVMAWPTATAPSGWLHCDGSAVSRTAYAELFAEIGTTYGVGDGSTTFNLPNYKGEFLRGWANGSTSDPDRGTRTDRGDGTTGDNVGTRQPSATASHAHTASLSMAGSGSTSSGGAHAHVYTVSADSNQSVGSSGNLANRGATTATTSTEGTHSHTVTVTGTASGTTDATGGNETRARNVSVMWIILANPAQASAAALGLAGFAFVFDADTADSNPGTGKLRINNATYSSATAIYASETDGYSAPIGAALQAIPANSQIYLFKVGDPGTYALFTTTASATDGGSYDKFTSLTYVSSNGTFSAGDNIAFVPFRAGANGSTGPQGADGGIRWTFDSSTTMGDPGAGELRLNNASLASVTAFAISANNAETGNPDISDWIAAWDSSTTTGDRGQIIIRKASATSNYVILTLTSDVTDNTTWLTGTVTVAASNGSLTAADQLLVSFHRTGDKGADGAGSGTVTQVTAGGGLSTNGVGSAGGTVTSTGTLTSVRPVNVQTGTSYTVVTGDNAMLLTFSNSSAVAVSLPQATSTFGTGWHAWVINKGAGRVTITPTTSTIAGGSSLVLRTNDSALIVSDGTNYDAVRSTGTARELLTANRTYYVRTDGSDSNDGLTNSSGGAFLTVQKAIDICASIDLGGYQATIQCGNGTYTGAVTVAAPFVGGSVRILGDTTTPANVLFSTTSASAISVSGGASLKVAGLKLSTTTSGSAISATDDAIVTVDGKMDLGATAVAHFYAQRGAKINISSDYNITAAALYHIIADQTATFSAVSRTITLSGSQSYTIFALAQGMGHIYTSGCSWSGGTISGTRYTSATNSLINTAGGGASHFPGNLSGATSDGGIYV